MDTLNELSEDGNFGKEVAKVFALSTATTAGMIAGLALVGLALEAYKKRKDKKEAKLQSTEK